MLRGPIDCWLSEKFLKHTLQMPLHLCFGDVFFRKRWGFHQSVWGTCLVLVGRNCLWNLSSTESCGLRSERRLNDTTWSKKIWTVLVCGVSQHLAWYQGDNGNLFQGSDLVFSPGCIDKNEALRQLKLRLSESPLGWVRWQAEIPILSGMNPDSELTPWNCHLIPKCRSQRHTARYGSTIQSEPKKGTCLFWCV